MPWAPSPVSINGNSEFRAAERSFDKLLAIGQVEEYPELHVAAAAGGAAEVERREPGHVTAQICEGRSVVKGERSPAAALALDAERLSAVVKADLVVP
jgi:hypothetical protein